MKKSNVIEILNNMIDGIQLKMKEVEVNSRVEFYHQGGVDGLKIALDMVKSIDSEGSVLVSDRNDDAS